MAISPTEAELGAPVLVPLQLEAFVLNPAVCGTGKDDDNGARIIPISQPNYTFLRLDNFLLQSDVQPHADVHSTAPSENNSRMTDLGARPPKPRRNRHGVYLHWILPRTYRAAVPASSKSGPETHRKEERLRRGLSAEEEAESSTAESSTPEFTQPPTRWLVVRKLDMKTIQPPTAKSNFQEYQAWVIESDYQWALDQIPLDYDLQVDVSPFVVGQAGENANIKEQAEVFIGRKTRLEDWQGEDPNANPPNISLLRSSNQLFADFQLHNTNVFSMLDNFEYQLPGQSPQYLDGASASYYLLGWHRKDTVDPLWKSGMTESLAHGDGLKALFMALKSNNGQADSWLQSKDTSRLLCHGAMYDVHWDHGKKPAKVPADDFAARLKNQTVPAISVGTTPLDSLISYCTARKKTGIDGPKIAQLEEDIIAIYSLLHATDDGVEGQREAKDTIYNWNFSRAKGGTHYFLSGEDNTGKPTEPEAKAVKALHELNQYQTQLDACTRASKQYRWDLFSHWWKYVSDVSNKNSETLDYEFRIKSEDLAKRVRNLEEQISYLSCRVKGLLEKGELDNAKPGTLPFYFRGQDPTVLVGGIDSGWPSDYLEDLEVRLPKQTLKPASPLPSGLMALISLVKRSLPADLVFGAEALLMEFYLLNPLCSRETQGTTFPQFHDKKGPQKRWRDQWGDQQPWFPLYAEWEIEYTHIPFERWSLDEQTARLSDHKLIRYGIKDPLYTVPKDQDPSEPEKTEATYLGDTDTRSTRILSGRVLILPQPSFSLAAKVTQLFTNTPPEVLDQYLKPEDRKALLEQINSLSYLSSPLSSLTEGLLTMAQGSHIKPENKAVGAGSEQSSAIKAALFTKAGFTKDVIELISGNSALTPYASMASFPDTEHSPFKPVTHGQMRFLKLNIIDKFGQALVAIDQKPRHQGRPPLYPCISDFYEPQVLAGTKEPNTVLKDNAGQCEFIQLPPQINQNARLNADFVMRASNLAGNSSDNPDDAYWRPATEWENPIWAWIVINYADYGIQFFLPDGTFYREVRIGGPEGALAEPKWTPFAPDPSIESTDAAQLDALISRLLKPDYLKGFWYMISTAVDNLPPTPSSYAQYLNSIVGKPLALVNMGWSLELDGPPLEIQANNAVVMESEQLLLKPRSHEQQNPYYEFQVKLGDKEREYDGLVGYFNSLDDPRSAAGRELDLDKVNTYFAPKKETMKPLNPITTAEYPKFCPFWVNPFKDRPTDADIVNPEVYADLRNRKLQVYGAILDPFTPVHAYSSFLPAKALSLPSWTWQAAMNNMTAFFHAGPLTLTSDVAEYNDGSRLTTRNWRDQPPKNVALPALGAGDWNWLQPFVDPDSMVATGREEDLDIPPAFNAFGIDKKGDLNKPGFQNGPYTVTEGFLQLRNPIMSQEPGAGGTTG